MNQKTLLLILIFAVCCWGYEYMEEWNPTNKVYFGKSTEWKPYDNINGIYVDVNFDELRLCKTPKVFTSLVGTSHHWDTTGATRIYQLSENHFSVYVKGVSYKLSV